MSAVPSRLDQVLNRMDYGRALRAELLMNGNTSVQVPYAQPLIDAIELFDELKIKYALIGGIAALYYGQPRFTEDVDFVAMTGHGDVLAVNPDAMHRHHFDPTCSHKLYHQSGVNVDLWKDEFSDDIVRRAVDVVLAGHQCKMIERHDLIAMKLRAQRVKDDSDIVEVVKNGSIDESRLRTLVTPEQFAHFESIKHRT